MQFKKKTKKNSVQAEIFMFPKCQKKVGMFVRIFISQFQNIRLKELYQIYYNDQ